MPDMQGSSSRMQPAYSQVTATTSLSKQEYRDPDKEALRAKVQNCRLGATLEATQMNDLAILRTCTDNRHRVARGRELI
jgi:hypothetical protein